jgi:hypothetical protein
MTKPVHSGYLPDCGQPITSLLLFHGRPQIVFVKTICSDCAKLKVLKHEFVNFSRNDLQISTERYHNGVLIHSGSTRYQLAPSRTNGFITSLQVSAQLFHSHLSLDPPISPISSNTSLSTVALLCRRRCEFTDDENEYEEDTEGEDDDLIRDDRRESSVGE